MLKDGSEDRNIPIWKHDLAHGARLLRGAIDMHRAFPHSLLPLPIDESSHPDGWESTVARPGLRDAICAAIRNCELLEFDYDGLRRVVAPYCHGFTQQGRGAASDSGARWKPFRAKWVWQAVDGRQDGRSPSDGRLVRPRRPALQTQTTAQ